MTDMTHRDEIHGDIRYDPLAVALLDTPTLQRLGRVYQLGYGHLVYRGGTHTRLSHAMGTFHMAARLVAALRRNYEGASRPPEGALEPAAFLPLGGGGDAGNQLADRWTVLRCIVSWAALLHDIGHVPLGHTLEDEFDGIYEKHDAFSSPRLRHLWLAPDSAVHAAMRRTELYPDAFARVGLTDGDTVAGAVLLICTWKEKILASQRTTFEEILEHHIGDAKRPDGLAPDLLATMRQLSPAVFAPYMADIVANTISADYLDYLRRDPQNLGLDVLRDDRVVSRFWVGRDHRGQARMALTLVDRRGKPRLDTCTGVVELVRQRYRFAEIVYYHKTKVAASAMLAKVFHLLGAPGELPTPRTRPTIADAKQRVDAILDASDRHRSQALKDLVSDSRPTSLLDPEIGDEGLDLLLRARATEQLETALKPRSRSREEEIANRGKAVDAVRSIALLDALARRELYKTAFTMDAAQFRNLAELNNTPHDDVERQLGELITDLRTGATRRADIEARMVKAAGWPDATMLLYVPGRKSQAKGIETGALADRRVVTLGDHPAVCEQVKELGVRYRALWRLIVLVHPDHADDVVGLSAAVDAFVGEALPGSDLDAHPVLAALYDCCWFQYYGHRDREAARMFDTYTAAARDADGSRWQHVRAYEQRAPRCSTRQIAIGASLLERLARRMDPESALQLVTSAGDPARLEAAVAEHASMDLASASLAGAGDSDPSIRATQRALDVLADELHRDGRGT
jgi:HD superfamily phosphohydrolase